MATASNGNNINGDGGMGTLPVGSDAPVIRMKKRR